MLQTEPCSLVSKVLLRTEPPFLCPSSLLQTEPYSLVSRVIPKDLILTPLGSRSSVVTVEVPWAGGKLTRVE